MKTLIKILALAAGVAALTGCVAVPVGRPVVYEPAPGYYHPRYYAPAYVAPSVGVSVYGRWRG